MKFLQVAVAATLSLGLCGCVASEQTFEKNVQIIRSRPDIRAKLTARCVSHVSAYSAEKRDVLAALFDVNASTFPQSFCNRIQRAYLSGRVTYQDYRDAMAEKPTVRLIRILRGK